MRLDLLVTKLPKVFRGLVLGAEFLTRSETLLLFAVCFIVKLD